MSSNSRDWSTGKVSFHMFSQARIDLNMELQNHPALCRLLANHTEFEVKLAEIAAWCGICLDGAYTAEDIDGICTACRNKLIESRVTLLVGSEVGLPPVH